MKTSRRPSSKVSAQTLVRAAIQLKGHIEVGLERVVKDPKTEKTLEEIIESFKKMTDSKEKSEYLQEFQKQEKILFSIIDKLKRDQEQLAKHQNRLKEKILDKLTFLKMPDADTQGFEEDKKKIEEAMVYIETTLKAAKEKLNRLAEKAGIALGQQEVLQAELEKFGLLAAFKDCEKEAKRLGEKLESVCEATARLSSKPSFLPETTRAGIKAFLPGFQTSLKRSTDLFGTAERHLIKLLAANADSIGSIASLSRVETTTTSACTSSMAQPLRSTVFAPTAAPGTPSPTTRSTSLALDTSAATTSSTSDALVIKPAIDLGGTEIRLSTTGEAANESDVLLAARATR